MKKFMRESKFRHVFGKPAPKEQQFEGVEVSKSRLDGNFVACNELFVACVLNTSGSLVLTVLRRDKPGRLESIPKCIGHTSEILDVSFDPFCPNRLLSGADDGSFICWWIPDDGLTENLEQPLATLKPSQRRAVQAIWHPSASDVVILANMDCISIYNLKDYTLIRSIDTSSYSDQIYSVSLNKDGSKIAASFKDKNIRIFDLYTGKMETEFQAYDGSKPTRVQFADKFGNFLCTTGFTKKSERRLSVWNLSDTSSAICTEDISQGVSALNIFYDIDVSLVCLYSKGSSIINLYELEASGQIFSVSAIQQGEQIRAGCFAPKLACDVHHNELMHFIKATDKGLEPISLIVPRKSDRFQDDIFPNTNSDQPAMSAAEFASGKRAEPLLLSLKDYQPQIGHTMPERQTSTIQVNANASISARRSSGNANEIARLEARIAALEEKVEKLIKG